MDVKQRLSLNELRDKLGTLRGTLEKRDFLPCQQPSSGVPRGVICEITGTARTEWIISFLLQNPELTTFWAEEKLTLLPTAFRQRGVDLSRLLIAETGDKLFQSLRKALRSKLFECVVLPGAIHEVKVLKALQLFARESNACVFFLSKTPKNAWAIPFQVTADWEDGSTEFRVEVLKSKLSQEVVA